MSTHLRALGRCMLLAGVLGLPAHAVDRQELELGNALDHTRLARDILLVDEDVTHRVNEIGQRIARHSGRDDLRFTFRVVNDTQVNAFATSGGFIYINTGLLDFCESEAELAAIIAHEVTHISEGHLLNHLENVRNEALSAELKKRLIQAVLMTAGASADPNVAGQLADLGGKVSQLIGASVIDPASQAAILGYKMDQEIEADKRAVKYLMDAGYDPHALIRVFEKMQGLRDQSIANGEPLACGWINKQPGLIARLDRVREALPESQTNAAAH